MPNTIAHLGVGGLITRAVIPGAETKWIYLGCIIPDIPWILQRAANMLPLSLDLYELRLYVIVQASLAGCLVLSAAISLVSTAPRVVFLILMLNSALHLLLDACQTKWANGVHLFAPFSWRPLSFDFFWPESLVTILLSAFGVTHFAIHWWRVEPSTIGIAICHKSRSALACALLACYFLIPLGLKDGPLDSDSHWVNTLRETDGRIGRYVEFDRCSYHRESEQGILRILSGEEIELLGATSDHAATLSARGVFVGEHQVQVHQFHVHAGGLRNYASLVGLLLVLLYWVRDSGILTARERGHSQAGTADAN